MFFMFFVFFFKHKTAYEVRISDWSSDVCSSDLFQLGGGLNRPLVHAPARPLRGVDLLDEGAVLAEQDVHVLADEGQVRGRRRQRDHRLAFVPPKPQIAAVGREVGEEPRSVRAAEMFLAALRPGGDVAIIAALGRLRTGAGEEQHKRSAEQAQRAVPGCWGSGACKRHRGVLKGGGTASVRRVKIRRGRALRADERRVGEEWGRTCISEWTQSQTKTTN